jgi:hypothetical protein
MEKLNECQGGPWGLSQGGLPGASPLRQDGSLGSHTGRLDWVSSGQEKANESQVSQGGIPASSPFR